MPEQLERVVGTATEFGRAVRDVRIPPHVRLAIAGSTSFLAASAWAYRSWRSGDDLRGALSRATTPLLPDDYLRFLNPLWTARELRGRVDKVVRETDDTATLVIKPGWGWSFDHVKAGQYIGIGVSIDGRWHWRSYSLSSAPKEDQGHLSITVKAMPEGFVSSHLVKGVAPGTLVRLATPAGDFTLPEPPPERILFLTGGSGLSPVMGMLRTLHRRGTMSDVLLIHSVKQEKDVSFRTELEQLEQQHEGFRLHVQVTDRDGMLTPDALEEVCPDWREREAWACGPEPFLDAFEEHWENAELSGSLHTERFTASLSGDGEGGHVVFKKSGIEVDIDGATTLMQAGEDAGIEMPAGCRMGICHTCVVPLESGTAKDLRNGKEQKGHEGAKVQTCIAGVEGECVLLI
jgi:stearoyl-CoA 9-desaturase NADPH oxidoreductase